MSQNHKNTPTPTINKTCIWGGREEGINPEQNTLSGNAVGKWDCVLFQVEVHFLDLLIQLASHKIKSKILKIKKYFMAWKNHYFPILVWFLPKKTPTQQSNI